MRNAATPALSPIGANYLNPRANYLNPRANYLNPWANYLNPWANYLNPWANYLNPWANHLNPGELWGIMGELWGNYGELWGIMGELWGNYGPVCTVPMFSGQSFLQLFPLRGPLNGTGSNGPALTRDDSHPREHQPGMRETGRGLRGGPRGG